MRHIYVVLQIFIALIFFNGCALFGEKKKNKDLTPAQLEQARAYMAANPNGPVAVSVADRQAVARMAGQMQDSPTVKELLKSNPVYRKALAQEQKLMKQEAADSPEPVNTGRWAAPTPRYTGGGSR